MLKHIRLRNHNGIENIEPLDLGSINIICGKNNSGKTSIIEAITNSNNITFGKKLDDMNWFEKKFEPMANSYSNPDPRISRSWFAKFIHSIISKDNVWFLDDFNKFDMEAKTS